MNEEYLIETLSSVNGVKVPESENKNQLIRALMNITMPVNLDGEFYQKQDEYLQGLLSKKKITKATDILAGKQIAIYLGDITEIEADAIVNACNSALLGCFVPGHHCIDNAIHSFAGLEVRRDLMNGLQGKEEPNGRCRVTSGYNLPSKFIFHTVGPMVTGQVTKKDEEDLKNCYLSCLKKADEMGLKTLVFCSISTGLYAFPIEHASKIAYSTVTDYLKSTNSKLCVIFDLFSKGDYEVYERLSKENRKV